MAVSKPCDYKISNAIALSIAIMARCRNNKLSAVAHRISAILIHSGAKSSDFTRLNELGICKWKWENPTMLRSCHGNRKLKVASY